VYATVGSRICELELDVFDAVVVGFGNVTSEFDDETGGTTKMAMVLIEVTVTEVTPLLVRLLFAVAF
jgi:hypothetical protein